MGILRCVDCGMGRTRQRYQFAVLPIKQSMAGFAAGIRYGITMRTVVADAIPSHNTGGELET